MFYIPGRIVHRAAATYRGDGMTDAKDARIIADQTRMRTNVHVRPRSGPDQCRLTTDCSQPAAPTGTARSATVFDHRSRRPSCEENASVIVRPGIVVRPCRCGVG
ncbi:IS110 family transposase [Rhodococcus sp. 24CO]|uniref:IS110 family transposase n=1 Tax=Rhodococcus sp. 24CO TaxID=3117460 RepID=UPI003D34ADDB